MTIIKVGGMHCSSCVARIEKALEKQGIKFSVSLENKEVKVHGDDSDVNIAKQVICDLGFDAD